MMIYSEQNMEYYTSSREELIEKGPAMKENMEKSDLSNGALNICNVIFETAGIR